MRMNKFVGVGLLVVVLAVGGVVAGFAAAKDVTANFAIPDYIAIYAANASVSLPAITVPDTYVNTNTLYVVSTKAWGVTHDFAWTSYPTGFLIGGGGANLFSVNPTDPSGTWGYNNFSVTYSLDLTDGDGVDDTAANNNMQYFPEGDYVVTVTHTATTSE